MEMTFADWVRGQRTKRRWSQGELARRLDMHRSYISRIEGGAIQLPEAETRDRFHAIFDTSDAELEALGIVPQFDEWGRVVSPPVARQAALQAEPDGESDTVDHLVALLRQVRLTDDREATLRGMLEMWVRRDQRSEAPDPAMRREAG